MTTVPAKYTTAYYEPGRNKPCVCGSGLKFKKCCRGKYSSNSSEQFKNAFNCGDYEEALLRARNHFTWYALSHKAHTPFLREDNREAGEYLLHIDIEALSEILENLHICYYRLERSNEFIDVVERVKNVISDERWNAKIAYTIGLWHLVDNEDEESAYTSLKSIDIKICQDPDILSLYIQVCQDDISLSDSLSIIDRIISNNRKESVKLQYRVLKAIKYYLVCQQSEADTIFEEAISKFSKLPDEKKSPYGKMQFAYALETYGKATNSQDILKQGRETVLELISEFDEELYTLSYKAKLYSLLGDFEEGLGKHQDAISAYLFSLDQSPSEIAKVFLARSLCNNGEHNKARTLLETISESNLDAPGKFDLAISWAIVSSSTLSVADINNAKERLKKIKTNDPAFIQLRDQWIIDLLETKPKSQQGRIGKLIKSLNKYVILNPNLFGFGINLNRIIDDIEDENRNPEG